MERNVKISLEKARGWYNSGNESLREVALQAFKESELVEKPWELIKTFEDACRVLNINSDMIHLIFDGQLKSMYKLKVIKKALNGAEWEPNLNTGTIYYPLLRCYTKGSSYDSWWIPVANFIDKKNNEIYTLVGGDCSGHDGGLGHFGFGYGDVYPDSGLFGCKSEEIAKYFGKTFGKLIFDAIYGQYNNYTWMEK